MAKNTAKTRGKRKASPSLRKASAKRPHGRAAAPKAKKSAARKLKKPPARTGKGKSKRAAADEDDDVKRKLGLRGAAPWAARHAAKHAAEARARNAVPPPPGSARATLRVPVGAEKIKERVAKLHGLLGKIRALRKNLNRGFYDLGGHLVHIRDSRLYEAKGYGSFENFVEREIDLGKTTALKLMRVPSIFQEEAALAHGMEAVMAALAALEGVGDTAANGDGGRRLPLKPPASGNGN